MAIRRILRPQLTYLLMALLFSFVYYHIHVDFLAPVWFYMKYDVMPTSKLYLSATTLIAISPVLFLNGFKKISAFLAALIFILCYIPAVFTVALNLEARGLTPILIQLALMVGMIMFFLADRIPIRSLTLPASRKLPFGWIHGATFICTLALVITYRNHMTLVSFDNIYDQRTAATEVSRNFIIDYMEMWLTSIFFPLYLILGYAKRNWLYVLLGCSGSVLIYAVSAAKASLLTPVIVLLMYLLLKNGFPSFMKRLFLGLSAICLMLLALNPSENPVIFGMQSLLFVRTLGIGGWAVAKYYDYFSANGFTHFSHIGIINHLTHAYAYGPFQPGQLLGLEVSGTEFANFNANFWATEGIAAWGIPGIIIINFFVFGLLVLFNGVSQKKNLMIVALLATPFSMTLMNLPFFTALLSGGGFLLMLILAYVRLDLEDTGPA